MYDDFLLLIKEMINLQKKIMLLDELLSLIVSRDKRASYYIYDTYAESLYAVICHSIDKQEIAEEALFEVFEKIFSNIAQYSDRKGTFFSWLLSLCRETIREKQTSLNSEFIQNRNFVNAIGGDFSKFSVVKEYGIQEFVKNLRPKSVQQLDLLLFKGKDIPTTSEILEIQEDQLFIQIKQGIDDLRAVIEN